MQSPTHLAPALHHGLYLPFSSCLPVVCVPRLRSHLPLAESPGGPSGISLCLSHSARVQCHDHQAELKIRHTSNVLDYLHRLLESLAELQAERTLWKRDLMHIPRADLNYFYPGRRPKPEIIASKEQQIQRDDPGASPQSSSQPDHGRLSRKPSAAPRGGVTCSQNWTRACSLRKLTTAG